MSARRTPVPRWKFPEKHVLRNEYYRSGRPPFRPFPSVTTVINAVHCPMAILHELYHGFDDALIKSFPEKRAGELFHKFTAYLKVLIGLGDLSLSGSINTIIERIRDKYTSFARELGFRTNELNSIWESYIRRWVERKITSGELYNIPLRDIFFELTVMNSHVRFPLKMDIGLIRLEERLMK